jgi:phosphoinositide-3-kinase regulatory subunit 4
MHRPLADVAVRYLEMGQALKAHGTFKVAADAVEYDEAQFEVSPFIVRFLVVDLS